LNDIITYQLKAFFVGSSLVVWSNFIIHISHSRKFLAGISEAMNLLLISKIIRSVVITDI